MSTAELADGIRAHHDREAPAERDHDPVGVLNLGLVQKHRRHDTISEQDQERRPDRLSTEDAQELLLSWDKAGAATLSERV